MTKTIVAVISKLDTQLKVSLILSLLIFFIPAFVHQQFLTGPIVNALLILSFLYLGKSRAFFLAMIPSTVALSRGLLPIALAPMVPFIMISNCLYIFVFAKFAGKSKFKDYLAVVSASTVKALFLMAISKFLMQQILAAPLASKVLVMMSWPQLWTAVVGGVLALLISYQVKKSYAK